MQWFDCRFVPAVGAVERLMQWFDCRFVPAVEAVERLMQSVPAVEAVQ